VITPRTTRLWRTPDLKAFQRAIVDLLPRDPFAAAVCAVIVPSRGAAEALHRTIEELALPSAGVRAIPALVTRDEFYASLRQRASGAPAALSGFEREVLLRRSANAASEAGAEPPFNIRAGLIAGILELYDELRRRHKTVADFDRLLTAALEPGADYDRGARRLLQQTRFLVETFTRFGYLFAAILPAGLFCATQERLLHEGDVVVLCGGGTGMTYGATALRWGAR